MTKKKKVLDKGFVRLESSNATDLSVVNSARVSFNNYHKEMEQGDEHLISFLLKNRHGTPFEHNSFVWHVKAPIFIAREWMRHRIGSFNEWSARYSELKREFYIPSVEHIRTQEGKPGAYTFATLEESKANQFRGDLMTSSILCYKSYKTALKQGVAKEQARFFLPVNIYTEFYWTVNARSLMNFLSLRNHTTAMWEIAQYAQALEGIWKQVMPITYRAFTLNERIAP